MVFHLQKHLCQNMKKINHIYVKRQTSVKCDSLMLRNADDFAFLTAVGLSGFSITHYFVPY